MAAPAPSVASTSVLAPVIEAAKANPVAAALTLLAVAVVYCALEQLSFRMTAPGVVCPPGLFVPLVGSIVDMVRDPYGYWERQRKLSPAGLSKFFLLGKTVFFTTDTDISRRVLMNNGPDSLQMVRAQSLQQALQRAGGGARRWPTGGPGPRMCPGAAWNRRFRLHPASVAGPARAPCIRAPAPDAPSPTPFPQAVHPSGKWILGPTNLAFQSGPEHKALRKSFLSLFTTKALGVYVAAQDRVVRLHIAKWLADPALAAPDSFDEMRDRIRDMNQETSQDVFVGPYLAANLRSEFGEHYRNMTDGFLSLPLPVPGTAVWRGMASRRAVIRILTDCAAAAKRRLAAGDFTPECLLDFWVEHLAEETAACAAEGRPAPKHASDHAIADTIMDFLFASQDASTASLTWLAALMCDHPNVAAKVREETRRVFPKVMDPSGADIDGDALYQLTYTRQVAKEALRWRPAAPMIPQVAAVDFPLADGVVAPRGSLVIPSLMAPVWSGQGFPNAEKFDPDRMSKERAEDVTHAKHFLTFGCGPHSCVGQTYAINHLVAFAARLAATVDLSRKRTPDSDDFLYLPTVYPKNCLLHLEKAA